MDLRRADTGRSEGRYISWINYYDIEFANRNEAGLWHTVEPPASYAEDAEWHPYGWGSERLPNTAHVRDDL
ncbi:MAG TPA: hypothetical protein VI670_22195 [Thermoanaerobaculia bacterium]